MRLLPILLLVVCCAVKAEWIELAESEDAYFYVDPATILKHGDTVEVWSLRNFFVRNVKGVASMRGYEQHDCKNKKWRVLTISSHSSRFAMGEMIFDASYEDQPNPWRRIPPDTIDEVIHKYVCKKK
jgi:hypothetical protein